VLALEIRRSVLDETESQPKTAEKEEESKPTLTRGSATMIAAPITGIFAGGAHVRCCSALKIVL
jgi:hypothetical protein